MLAYFTVQKRWNINVVGMSAEVPKATLQAASSHGASGFIGNEY